MNQPSVSIIVPVYNVGPYVEDCIHSVMRQTYNGRMECIVVDDCGTDDSMVIVERVIKDYNGPITFKILHHTHNRGLSAARNTGMDAATGDYLFFLDSDDELTDDCLEKQVSTLHSEWYDIVVGNVECYDILPDKRKRIFNLEFNIENDVILRSPEVIDSIIKWRNVTAWNRLFRASFIKSSGLRFKEGMLHEDNLWSLQVACLASSLYLLNQFTYRYKRREGSITMPFNKGRKMDCLTVVIQEMDSFIEEKNISESMVFPAINKYFSEILQYHFSSRKDFIRIYKQVRPFIRARLNVIVRTKGRFSQKYLYNFHFLLPVRIAPYWQYTLICCQRLLCKHLVL
jgi:glycosyltransferase involved in cell wall biosynthesis